MSQPVPHRYSSIPARRGTAAPASSPPDEEQYPVPSGYRLRPGLLIMVLSTLVGLGAGTLAVVLLVGGSEPAPGPATRPAGAPAVPPGAGEGLGPAPGASTGTATLSDPTITAAKAPLTTAGQWCSLLSAADVRAVTGFEQRGLPDGTSLCTHYLADDAGYLFVSDIPALQGAAHTVRGNSAIVYQSNPASCEVTVALNRGGGVLDIDLRGVVSPRVPLCQAAANLVERAFDRLPAK